MKPLIFSILASLTCPAFARLGETPEQCNARYGEPVSIDKDKKEITYQKAGLLVLITFWNGSAQYIIIGKSERDAIDRPVKMSDAEIETIVQANAGDQKTKPGSEGGVLDKAWETLDGKRIALYMFDSNVLVLSTKAYALEKQRLKAETEKKNLEGF
jgi:hypothetical protein